jgi:hypothetical protein
MDGARRALPVRTGLNDFSTEIIAGLTYYSGDFLIRARQGAMDRSVRLGVV